MNHAADLPPQQPPRHGRRLSPGFAVGAAAVLALIVWWQWPKHAAHAAVPAVPVVAGHPVLADFPIRAVAVGTVQARNAVDVKVRVDGQLQRVLFAEGQDVKAGQLLAQLDQGPLTAQLHQAEATQGKDQASLENARLDFDRYSKLVGIGAATTQSVDTARAQVKALTATVAADAAIVQNDRLQLGFTTLTAPFAGRVGVREADLGAIVHPGDATGIVTVTQMEPIDVQFSVPQDVLPDVLAGQQGAPLPVTVTARAGGTPLAQGTLSFIDSQVDRTTGQIRLKGAFANTDRKLWPGELVTAQVLLRTDRQRLAVPSRAIVNTQAGPQLYAIDASGNARLRVVRTGAAVDGMIEIASGVAAGDLVVFEGQSRLNPGTPVAAKRVDARDEAVAPVPPATLDASS
ncbi:RND family efflux transporter MFP subunit [Burkholderia aenigmatica]|uniref:RND family efflux transporter MFP subunit n=2 Tax=Burkholderia TaxID=32008 RepID=A0ABY6XV73_9BURK|nr:efflux RND transporter periplasmic adaptor subunit [Burkholderia aenigmatica]VWC88218.1 RND family efflux transporter MFP subunit [Burkholderia aenigmatica]VWC99273.1 RND family efflux transporter MFP subunit [Burkholderia aenigmatica]